MIRFESDYLEGALPEVMRALNETNLVQTPGYGEDEYCAAAAAKIHEKCAAAAAQCPSRPYPSWGSRFWRESASRMRG